MTTGERIQTLRKREGLSQEQLGEKLNVTRQAISKWESDVTLPEVEKLVAMSRLFRVNVGVLLGVEEEQESAAGGEGLTERELAAVEAVAARYAPHAPPRRLLPICLTALCGLLLAVSLVCNLIMSREWAGYKSSTDSALAALRGQISLLQAQPPTVTTADDFFSAQVCEVDGVDTDAGTATLRLSVTPKRYVEGMTAQFILAGQDFAAITTPPQSAEGQTFSTTVSVPLDDDITVTAAVKEGAITETRPLGNLYDLKKTSTITINTWWEASRQAAVELTVGRHAQPPTAASLQVWQDGEMVNQYRIDLMDTSEPRPNGAPEPIPGSSVTYYVYPTESEDEAQFVAWVKDAAGREYSVPVEMHLAK